MRSNNCGRCGCNADTLYHVDGAKSITEWVCGKCAMGYVIPTTDHLAAIQQLTDRLAQVERELERERMRLAGCGVVALANTRESARMQRPCHPDYDSASKRDVEHVVDEQMDLLDRLAQVERERDNLQKDVTAAFRKHGLAPGPTAIDGLVRQLAEAKAERDDIKLNRMRTLCEFCVYLEDYGFIDSDWRIEEPSPIDGFNKQMESKNKPRDPSAAQGAT